MTAGAAGDDSAFAGAANAWAQGIAAQQIAMLQSEAGSPVIGGEIAQLADMLQAVQGFATTAGGDADALAQAQTELSACQ